MELFFKDFNVWLQGMLFVLAIYHLGAYIFTKDRSFILYATYLVLVLIYLIPKSHSQTSVYLRNHYPGFFETFNWIIQFWFWIFYTWFSLLFLNIKEKNKKLDKIGKIWTQGVAILSTLFFVIDFTFCNGQYLGFFFSVIYIPFSLIYIAYFFIIIFKYKDPLNKFYTLGFFSYLFFALVALYFSLKKEDIVAGIMTPIDLFMVGVFLETIILSIGLGYKYHIFRVERDDYNLQLIKEYQRNEKLKDKINEQLSEKVEVTSLELQNVSKQAEIYKIEQLETHYKNKINTLKLSSLLNQMNPHFIFNALNSIKLFIINNEPKKAAHYLNKFSKLIRRILEAPKTKSVSLAEELETTALYISMENIRFSNEIEFLTEIHTTVDVESIQLPSLILQPFIEKAIWDGLSSKKGDKKIILSILDKGEKYIVISIEDNGIGRNAAAKIKADKSINRNYKDLELTKARLENFTKGYVNKYSIKYTDITKESIITGTKVTLLLPLF